MKQINEQLFLDSLNSIKSEGTTIFRDTVIRIADNQYHLMNKPHTGWSSMSKSFDCVYDIFKKFKLTATGIGQDGCSTFITVTPKK